jgi:enolase-phosphatase E1
LGALLFDVEGTITSLAFVKEELFPYARRALPEFLQANADRPGVNAIVYRLSQELKLSPADLDSISATLVGWIDEDRKHPELKELEGMIWEEGYRAGAYQGHLYPDVIPFWKRAKAAGCRLAIYSSGSVHAQRLLLQSSAEGDVSHFIDCHFATQVGPKSESDSYHRIASGLELPPPEIEFYSDSVAELDAARTAGFRTCRTVRPGVPPVQHTHREIEDFAHDLP